MRAVVLAISVMLAMYALAASVSLSVMTTAHATTYTISQETVTQDSICSATAIGPHALLTASHCEIASDVLTIRGVKDDVSIAGIIRDAADHSILLITGTTFKSYASVNTRKPQLGESVFFFGNPGKWRDVAREGYLSGFRAKTKDEPDALMLDMQGYPGDSGAAVFNDTGRIITLVTATECQTNSDAIRPICMAIGYKLAFTNEQLDAALLFGTDNAGDLR